jgi:hypothetical protein
MNEKTKLPPEMPQLIIPQIPGLHPDHIDPNRPLLHFIAHQKIQSQLIQFPFLAPVNPLLGRLISAPPYRLDLHKDQPGSIIGNEIHLSLKALPVSR